MQNKTEIRIYGDSIMMGTVIDENNRYRATIAEDLKVLEDKYSITLGNRAKFGMTVDKGLSRIEKDLENGMSCSYALVEFGGNDCNFRWSEVAEHPEEEHFPATPRRQFEELLISAVEMLKAKCITPVLMTLPPIDAERYLAFIAKAGNNCSHILSWLGDVQMIYRFQELYSSAVTKLAYETGCPYVDLRAAFLDKHNYADLLCADGIHPNEAGHALIAQTFANAAETVFGGAYPARVFSA